MWACGASAYTIQGQRGSTAHSDQLDDVAWFTNRLANSMNSDGTFISVNHVIGLESTTLSSSCSAQKAPATVE